MNRDQVAQWAAALGVHPAVLTMAIVLGSERPGRDGRHTAEQLGIAHTMLNRTLWPRSFGGRDVWSVAIGAPTTGPQGASRPYASSRPKSGADLLHLLQVANAAIAQAQSGQRLGLITHFHHLTGERRRIIEDRRRRQGYQVVSIPGIQRSSIVQFMGPTAAKVAQLNRAEPAEPRV